jgi:endonuclease/exonuclease/phosphatase (EEP) superfamily protein YafD
VTSLSIAAALTLLLVVATLIPVWSHRSWLVRGLDFPRLQLMWFALGLMALIPVIPDIQPVSSLLIFTGLLLCCITHAWHVLAFSPLARKEVASTAQGGQSQSFTLLIANVLMTNKRTESLIAAVENYRPDLVLTLETDERWEASMSVLAEQFPFRVAQAQDNLYGMHLFSRLPLAESEISYLVQKDVPSIHTLIEMPCGTSIRAHFLHPAPPSPTENPSSQERDSEVILVAKSLERDGFPVILGGDLNDVGWSKTMVLFKRISGLRDVRIGRGLFCTYNAKYRLLRWPLDHLFVSSHFLLKRLERVSIKGSDHFALFAELVLQSTAEVENSPPNLSTREERHIAESLDSQAADVEDVPQPGQ